MFFSKIREWVETFQRHGRQREEQVFLVLTLLIGVLVSMTVVAFIVLTEREGARLFPDGATWRILLIPVAGSVAMGYLLYRYAPGARGSGIVQTKVALFVRNGVITLRTVLGKFFFVSATLASGIPLGPEGPAVQVGGGIASVLGRALGLSEQKVKALIPVGGSAAIAAAFNAPLAGVLYALEELVGDLNAPVLGSVVLSAATSWIVLRLFLGDEPLFHVPQYEFVSNIEFGVYAVLGVLGGVVSLIFIRSLLRLRVWFKGLPVRTVWLQPVAGGALVALIGLFVPSVLGVGYVRVGEALNGQMGLRLMALLVALKLLTVVVAYASGNAGGIFAPALFIGAMAGGALGSVAHQLLPNQTATAGAYALVGMGAAFAGIVRAPMTSVIMIFEVTHDYAIIVPLMIANLVSFYISRRWEPQTIYEQLSLQDGIHLPVAESRDAGLRFRVAHVMRPPVESYSEHALVSQAMESARASEFRAWPVMGDHGIVGWISWDALRRAHASGGGDKPVGHLVDRLQFPHVHEDQSLELALQRLGQSGMDALPVVSRANVRQILGVIKVSDVLHYYGINSAGPVEATGGDRSVAQDADDRGAGSVDNGTMERAGRPREGP
jgi:CIC family chloride channel protein